MSRPTTFTPAPGVISLLSSAVFTVWVPVPVIPVPVIDTDLDTLLANQTARKALPPTIAKSNNRKMAGYTSYY